MKSYIYCFLCLLLVGCMREGCAPTNRPEVIYVGTWADGRPAEVRPFFYDGCEYIVLGHGFAHKGNCTNVIHNLSRALSATNQVEDAPTTTLKFGKLERPDGPCSASLGWLPVTEQEVAGYRIYYGTNSERYLWTYDAGNRTNCTIKGLHRGTTYYFRATSYTKSGAESQWNDFEQSASFP